MRALPALVVIESVWSFKEMDIARPTGGPYTALGASAWMSRHPSCYFFSYCDVMAARCTHIRGQIGGLKP